MTHHAHSESEPEYRTMSTRPDPTPSTRGPAITSVDQVVALLADLKGMDREHFVCFDLDVRHRVIERRLVAIGTLTNVEVHPREVFKGAILNSAAAVIVAHNHPSGDPNASRQDMDLTATLRGGANLLGIKILDHVIVAANGFWSFADRGWV